MIQNVFTMLLQQGAVISAPADKRTVQLASSMLASNRMASIPAEYQQLLELANGLVYNGFEFFGTKDFAYRDEAKLPNIADVNLDVNADADLTGQVLIGRGQNELFLYDENKDDYFAADRLTMSKIRRYKNLEILLNTIAVG
ncbi:MAG: YrhA family protein [Alphaproteobacteria bacterium]|nr:YrhA family protein [Alphaproteobacteria bacterium]